MCNVSFERLEDRRLMSIAVASGGAVGAAPSAATVVTTTPTPTPIVQGTGVSIHAALNQQFSGVVGTFAHLVAPPGHQLFVTIYWGDDVASKGTIKFANGGATVSGTHTWHVAGDYLVRAYVYASPFILTPAGVATGIPIAHVQSIASVVGGNATGTIIKPVRTKPFSGAIGSFTTSLDLSKYNVKVTIEWGDGTAVSAGSVVKTAAGHYQVRGEHTYSRISIFEIKVRVTATLKGSPAATAVVLVAALNSLGEVQPLPTPTAVNA